MAAEALLDEPRFTQTWTPFSIRYGHQKISDWARKTEHYPATPGQLWEMVSGK